ncbi:hypothetical protein [Bordetella sp. LUAb4]|uniref:hypothetical protein n=1 Tax=Bordetella sp. LUAb4 TaxID=2843195 RepID=UPI001E4519D3|nr:hypothetical protein [Bordetella sp. LUAb4]
MDYSLSLAGMALGFFLLLLGAMRLGRRISHRRDERSGAGVTAVEGAVFAFFENDRNWRRDPRQSRAECG